jgi:hypothetical protein
MHDPDERIIADFQRRRKRMLFNFGCSLVLFALGMAVALITGGYPSPVGIQHKGWGFVAIAQLLAGLIIAVIGFRQYRCPACQQIVTGHDKYYLGVLIDPTHCPACGVRLK